MNGQALVNFLISILDSESIDPTFVLQMINIARGYIEDRRPFQIFKAVDSSNTVPSGNNYLVGINLPTNFRKLLPSEGQEGGVVQLFNGSNIIQTLTEVPFEQRLQYRNSFGHYCIHYGTKEMFILGTVPGPLTLYINYIADYGDITLSTQWGQSGLNVAVPSKYHPMLAYETAAMWRLGTDYDSTSARNADDNAKRADLLYKGMEKWDAELALSNVGRKDYHGDTTDRNWGRGPGGYFTGPR